MQYIRPILAALQMLNADVKLSVDAQTPTANLILISFSPINAKPIRVGDESENLRSKPNVFCVFFLLELSQPL